MIVDCGGGTVDITIYTVKATDPVLDFKELEVGNGRYLRLRLVLVHKLTTHRR